MIISVHQSSYLPWYGFFEKIYKSDVFVIHDEAQFEKQGFLNRNRIKTSQGPLWLTIPVITKGYKEIPLREILIDNRQDWRRKHWKTIQLNYDQTPYFHQYKDYLEDMYSKHWVRLHDINMEFTNFILKELRIQTPIHFVSDLPDIQQRKSGFILELCRRFGADVYYSGSLGVNYLIGEEFEKESIKIIYQKIREVRYTQQFKEFIPHLSVLDILLNCGADATLKIIKGEG